MAKRNPHSATTHYRYVDNRGLTVNGYAWCAYQDGAHFFKRQCPTTKRYTEIRCTQEMILNGDLEFMSEHSMTYDGRITISKKAMCK